MNYGNNQILLTEETSKALLRDSRGRDGQEWILSKVWADDESDLEASSILSFGVQLRGG